MPYRPLITPNTESPLIGIGSRYNSGSMSASITGPATIIQELPGIAYSVVWTGAPVGTFEVQVSNDYTQNKDGTTKFAGNWNTLPVSSFQGNYPVPSGTPDHGMLDVCVTNVYAIRLVYNRTSGTGQLTAVICAKVL